MTGTKINQFVLVQAKTDTGTVLALVRCFNRKGNESNFIGRNSLVQMTFDVAEQSGGLAGAGRAKVFNEFHSFSLMNSGVFFPM